jgi:type II secretory pathway predicted ATPase ExeA
MDYISRYGLEFNPFLKGKKNTAVETSQYREVQTRLNYLLQTKGFGLLTGQPGMGKTTAVRNWVDSLNAAAYKPIYISLSTLTVMEFYRMLCLELGYEPAFRKAENFRTIQKAIDRYVIEKRMTPIIILDEANYLKNATLNDLKILFNFDMDSINKAVILLAGLPQLNATLRLAIHEPLAQRITMNYEIKSLSTEEAVAYIKEKLKTAGCHMEVFEKNALEAIAGASNGIPRVIDKISNQALLIGNTLNENIITADTIMKTVEDLQI